MVKSNIYIYKIFNGKSIILYIFDNRSKFAIKKQGKPCWARVPGRFVFVIRR